MARTYKTLKKLLFSGTCLAISSPALGADGAGFPLSDMGIELLIGAAAGLALGAFLFKGKSDFILDYKKENLLIKKAKEMIY